MTPIMLATEGLEILLQESPHSDDTFRHFLDFTEPLLIQNRAIEDLGGDSGTVHWRIGIKWSDEDFDLRIHAFLLLCRFAHDGEGADALAVESLTISVPLPRGDCEALPCSLRNFAPSRFDDPPARSA